MSNHPQTIKAALFTVLRALGVRSAYFSMKCIKSALETEQGRINEKTLRNYLSEAMAEEIIHDAGRGWYSCIPSTATLEDSGIGGLRDLMAKRFPFLPHYLWSTLQLNPWMHHLIGKPIRFLHADAGVESDLEEFLRAEGWDVLVNPTSKTAARLVPGPKCLVLRSVRREIDSDAPPTVATVLVDALLENGRLHFMDEVERKEMTRRLMQEKRIDFAALHSRLKNHKKTIEDLIGTGKSGIISEF